MCIVVLHCFGVVDVAILCFCSGFFVLFSCLFVVNLCCCLLMCVYVCVFLV